LALIAAVNARNIPGPAASESTQPQHKGEQFVQSSGIINIKQNSRHEGIGSPFQDFGQFVQSTKGINVDQDVKTEPRFLEDSTMDALNLNPGNFFYADSKALNPENLVWPASMDSLEPQSNNPENALYVNSNMERPESLVKSDAILMDPQSFRYSKVQRFNPENILVADSKFGIPEHLAEMDAKCLRTINPEFGPGMQVVPGYNPLGNLGAMLGIRARGLFKPLPLAIISPIITSPYERYMAQRHLRHATTQVAKEKRESELYPKTDYKQLIQSKAQIRLVKDVDITEHDFLRNKNVEELLQAGGPVEVIERYKKH